VGTGEGSGVVYTKWYRVWERTKPSDFMMEGVLIPIILLALLVHFWGTRRNSRKARTWMAVHAPLLEREFALVGYHRVPKVTPYAEGVQSDAGLIAASAKLTGDHLPDDMIKEKAAWEYETYASGRQNAAFMDVKVVMKRWMNPMMMIAEEVAGMIAESVKPRPEHMEAVLYTFDGKEKDFVPPPVPGSEEISGKRSNHSTYDGFVFAIVNKMVMRRLRDERYDLSLTFTKDHAKLPDWVTVMSESAEVSEFMLTKELVEAVKQAGDLLEYLIVTDQPTDKPTTLNETTPKKRLHLSLRLPSDGNYLPTLPIFQAFLRLPDFLVSSAKLRPEVARKVNAVREAEKSKLKKVGDKEAEEERLRTLEKMKRDERERKMKGMSAEEQRKFLDRENEKQRKKQEKKMTRRG
jgi:hypothetical protein